MPNEPETKVVQPAPAPIPMQQDTGPVADSPSSRPSQADRVFAAAKDLVTTTWLVDYNKIGGHVKGLHGRGDTQLIVEQLKVQSADGTVATLKGGNDAQSGAVELGSVLVPKGPGMVSAAVHYAQTSKLHFDIKMQPALSRTEQSRLATEFGAKLDSMLQGRGDYEAIAAELKQAIEAQYPGRSVRVRLEAARGQTERQTTETADYAADADSRFRATIEPSAMEDSKTNLTESRSGHEGSESTNDVGFKNTAELDTTEQTTKKTKMMAAWKTLLSTNTHEMIRKAGEWALQAGGSTDTVHREHVTWKAGLGPAPSNAKPANDVSGGSGILGKIASKVSKAGKWRMNSNRVTGFIADAAGSLWDMIKTTGSVTREALTGDETKIGTAGSSTLTASLTKENVEELASSMSSELVTETEVDVETIIATKVASEMTGGQAHKHSDGTDLSSTSSGEKVVHEVGRPIITVKKLS